MADRLLLDEFIEAMEKNKKRLEATRCAYLEQKIRSTIIKKMFLEAERWVLEHNKFYATKDSERIGVGVREGDRITDPDLCIAMSDKDFERFNSELCLAEYVKRGLTEQDGTYKPGMNYDSDLFKAKDALIQLLIEVLPDSITGDKKTFSEKLKRNCKLRERFFDLAMMRPTKQFIDKVKIYV